MACYMDPLLQMHDTFGSRGCAPYMLRRNLLTTMRSIRLTENSVALKMDIHSPEGFGIECFGMDCMECPVDGFLETDTILHWDCNTSLPPADRKIWLFNVRDEDIWEGRACMHFAYDHESSWVVTPEPKMQDKQVRVLECFSGGVGGWSANSHQVSPSPWRSAGQDLDRYSAEAVDT